MERENKPLDDIGCFSDPPHIDYDATEKEKIHEYAIR
jgi:hypothetical protein